MTGQRCPVPVLRVRLCFITDDKEHMLEVTAVLELTDADVLAKVQAYNKAVG